MLLLQMSMCTCVNEALCQNLEKVLVVKDHAVANPRELLHEPSSKGECLR